MKPRVICRTVDKGIQAFYMIENGKEYYLFKQNFRKSIKTFFAGGVLVDKLSAYSSTQSYSVRKVLDKIPTFIHYIEKEKGLIVYNKSLNKTKNKKQKPYKRERFKMDDYMVS